ncbi:DUF1361 domain-containing protein [Ktedonospora formicarum]|uniref:DUF1361 domain-containing protein n=1 Tax=Ktedonospora formicarum TaxID=2778364 RepID=UPI001C6926AC|nr:DUF1361 domain-containing protein [Ktedonospora formicarum]
MDQSKPVEDTTWWFFFSMVFFLLAVCFLLWGSWAKPPWMSISVANGDVALLSAGFTYLFLCFLRIKSRVAKCIFGFLWLLFLPNVAYLFTDLGHLPAQWNQTATASGRMLLLVQYLLLEWFAIIMFLYTLLPFEKMIDQLSAFKKRKVLWLILSNFFVAYGTVLGRFEHINSWILFINPLTVLRSAMHMFVSFDLLGLTIFFGLLFNCISFLWRTMKHRTRETKLSPGAMEAHQETTGG